MMGFEAFEKADFKIFIESRHVLYDLCQSCNLGALEAAGCAVGLSDVSHQMIEGDEHLMQPKTLKFVQKSNCIETISTGFWEAGADRAARQTCLETVVASEDLAFWHAVFSRSLDRWAEGRKIVYLRHFNRPRYRQMFGALDFGILTLDLSEFLDSMVRSGIVWDVDEG